MMSRVKMSVQKTLVILGFLHICDIISLYENWKIITLWEHIKMRHRLIDRAGLDVGAW
jgi:hypothetical protein